MIIKCDETWTDRIISYIGNHYESCLYLYADIKRYGTDSEAVNTWVNTVDNHICAIIMTYHNGMHIFSKNFDYDKSELISLIMETRPDMVLGVESLVSDIYDSLENYCCEYGFVKKMDKEKSNIYYENIRTASLDDVSKLTDMLMDDTELMASYTYDEMFNQICERINDGFGNTYYIFDGEDICAQAGISADLDCFSVISNVFTSKKYRGKKYASSLLHYINEISGKKSVYLFCYGEELSAFYDAVGFSTVQLWGKLYVRI